MKLFGEAIDNYVNEVYDVMVIPDEILKKDGDKIKEGLRQAKKLAKRLKHGDTSVFKDFEDWDIVR